MRQARLSCRVVLDRRRHLQAPAARPLLDPPPSNALHLRLAPPAHHTSPLCQRPPEARTAASHVLPSSTQPRPAGLRPPRPRRGNSFAGLHPRQHAPGQWGRRWLGRGLGHGHQTARCRVEGARERRLEDGTLGLGPYHDVRLS